MPAHGHYGETRGVRWFPDPGEFKMKCDSCAAKGTNCYWPITTDFWNPRTMQRCRACDYERRSAQERQKRIENQTYRERRNADAARYYKTHKAEVRVTHRFYMQERRRRQKEEAA